MDLVIEKRSYQTWSKFCSETNRLGLSETYYTIIISVWKLISEAVYEEVSVILFSAPSAA